MMHDFMLFIQYNRHTRIRQTRDKRMPAGGLEPVADYADTHAAAMRRQQAVYYLVIGNGIYRNINRTCGVINTGDNVILALGAGCKIYARP